MRARAARSSSAAVLVLGALLMASPQRPHAESLGDVFERVAPSVVVVRTTERDIADEGQQRTVSISGFGSGVLIAPDGKVLTAAHLVHAASEVHVEFVGGARVARA